MEKAQTPSQPHLADFRLLLSALFPNCSASPLLPGLLAFLTPVSGSCQPVCFNFFSLKSHQRQLKPGIDARLFCTGTNYSNLCTQTRGANPCYNSIWLAMHRLSLGLLSENLSHAQTQTSLNQRSSLVDRKETCTTRRVSRLHIKTLIVWTLNTRLVHDFSHLGNPTTRDTQLTFVIPRYQVIHTGNGKAWAFIFHLLSTQPLFPWYRLRLGLAIQVALLPFTQGVNNPEPFQAI